MSEMQKIGEVIEATSTDFIAESYELYELPPLGSLVKIVDTSLELYGIVCQATTTGIEPGRRPLARGKDEVSEDAVYRSSPQLLKLLRSEFSVLVVGYGQNDVIYQYLPPKPARIHAFVYQCSREEVNRFSQSLDFLNILINAHPDVSTEELVAAVLRDMSRSHEDTHEFLIRAGKELADQLSGEYAQLKAILGRLR